MKKLAERIEQLRLNSYGLTPNNLILGHKEYRELVNDAVVYGFHNVRKDDKIIEFFGLKVIEIYEESHFSVSFNEIK